MEIKKLNVMINKNSDDYKAGKRTGMLTGSVVVGVSFLLVLWGIHMAKK